MSAWTCTPDTDILASEMDTDLHLKRCSILALVGVDKGCRAVSQLVFDLRVNNFKLEWWLKGASEKFEGSYGEGWGELGRGLNRVIRGARGWWQLGRGWGLRGYFIYKRQRVCVRTPYLLIISTRNLDSHSCTLVRVDIRVHRIIPGNHPPWARCHSSHVARIFYDRGHGSNLKWKCQLKFSRRITSLTKATWK